MTTMIMHDTRKDLYNIGQIVKSTIGFAELSKRTGLSRTSLYKSLDGDTNTKVDTVMKICKAMDIQIKLELIA